MKIEITSVVPRGWLEELPLAVVTEHNGDFQAIVDRLKNEYGIRHLCRPMNVIAAVKHIGDVLSSYLGSGNIPRFGEKEHNVAIQKKAWLVTNCDVGREYKFYSFTLGHCGLSIFGWQLGDLRDSPHLIGIFATVIAAIEPKKLFE